MKTALYYIYYFFIRLVVWLIATVFSIWILSAPIIHWIPIVSHIFVLFYIFLVMLLITAFWQYIMDMDVDEKTEKNNL